MADRAANADGEGKKNPSLNILVINNSFRLSYKQKFQLLVNIYDNLILIFSVNKEC